MRFGSRAGGGEDSDVADVLMAMVMMTGIMMTVSGGNNGPAGGNADDDDVDEDSFLGSVSPKP